MSVCEALFEAGFSCRVAGTGEDGVMVRERIHTNILRNLSKGLDCAIEAQAATEEQKAKACVEPFEELRYGTVEVNVAVVAVGVIVFSLCQHSLGGVGEIPVEFEEVAFTCRNSTVE